MNLRILLGTGLAAIVFASPLASAGDHALAKAEKVAKAADVQVVKLAVTKEGFEPAVVKVQKGRPVKLVVTRTVERTCATEIVMKDFGINQPLPLGQEVAVTVTPTRTGDFKYSCAMNMIGGTLKVE